MPIFKINFLFIQFLYNFFTNFKYLTTKKLLSMARVFLLNWNIFFFLEIDSPSLFASLSGICGGVPFSFIIIICQSEEIVWLRMSFLCHMWCDARWYDFKEYFGKVFIDVKNFFNGFSWMKKVFVYLRSCKHWDDDESSFGCKFMNKIANSTF